MPLLIEVLLEALDVFKNFLTSISSTRNLTFWFISIGLDFSTSETVVGQILQSAIIDFDQFWRLKFSESLYWESITENEVFLIFWQKLSP